VKHFGSALHSPQAPAGVLSWATWSQSTPSYLQYSSNVMYTYN